MVEDEAEEEQEKVKSLAAELRELQKTPEAARKRWPGFDQEVAKVQAELDKAKASIRDAKPLERQMSAI